ncbi:MAG: hypothetical protein K8T89_00320 [Planctomycetes bacterium]|nr:hypothetical protein [Planctomycetota bacterium]
MLRSRIAWLALVGTFIVSQAGAEEEYDLRGPAPIKGQIYTLTAKSTGKDLTRTFTVMGKSAEERFSEITTKKKEIEVLSVQGFEISKMRTKILQDQRDEIVRKGKRDVKKSVERDLNGQIIYSERMKTGWKNSLEDVSPTDKQKKLLKEYTPFKEEDILYPAGKVKVGHEWKIDPELFARVLANQFESMKATGTGKFLRVEKVDGEDQAVLEMEFQITGKEKEESLILDVVMKGKGIVYRSLKHGFDRKSTTVLQMSMKGGGEVDGQKIEVEFTGTTNAEDVVEMRMKKD